MKRHPALRRLSDDHHRALVLSRRLRRLPDTEDPASLAQLAREVRREFETELEPHFGVEERWLLPALESRGGGSLAASIRRDHARLRTLVDGAWSADTAGELGALLARHVRFEERVVFPEAERLLSPAALEAIRAAADATAMEPARSPQRPD